PNAPSNPSPSDGATNQSRSNLNVTWSGGDPDAGDTVIYTRYLGTDNPPTEYVVDLPNPSFSCGGLSPNTTWYWQVVTTDNHGASTSGPIWSFTTGN
ncbi:hypothetical protein KJ693_09535, partial [bacterium]|nr:hypothetical protein [bacterium]